MYKAFFLMIVQFVMVLLTGCATDIQSGSDENLHDRLQHLADRNHVCSATVAVIRARALAAVEAVSGCKDVPAPHPDSVFQAASLGKPLFAYAVLKLVQQRRLQLDIPLMTYLPQGYFHESRPFSQKELPQGDWVTDPRLQQVTARMVLQHTSGLPNWSRGLLSFSFAPGTRWQYSGEAYLLLQRVVEKITGQSLNDLMVQQVLQPQSMQHSAYVWDAGFDADAIPAFAKNGTQTILPSFKRPVVSTTLYTSAADYGKFLTTVLNDADMLRQMTAAPVEVDAGLHLSWGQGWGIERHPDDMLIWHWGNNPGYRSFVMASVQRGDGFVLLTNSEDGLRLAAPLARRILPGEHPVFGFRLLGGGVAETFCDKVRWCF